MTYNYSIAERVTHYRDYITQTVFSVYGRNKSSVAHTPFTGVLYSICIALVCL